MNFTVDFSEEASAELKRHQRSGQKILLNKIREFVKECQVDPREGTGKPKPLKHRVAETWSRKINNQHRFIIGSKMIWFLSYLRGDIMMTSKLEKRIQQRTVRKREN